MAHPDEAVKPVEEVPSAAIAAAQLRHEQAKSDTATPQEKKQAAVEQAHALSTRPDGSYAQLHEGEIPVLAVADKAEKKNQEKDLERAEKALKGEAGSPEEQRREELGIKNPATPVDTTGPTDKK